jgi:hypothetical protein
VMITFLFNLSVVDVTATASWLHRTHARGCGRSVGGWLPAWLPDCLPACLPEWLYYPSVSQYESR